MRTLLFILFTFVIFTAIAQEQTPKDVIKFKDGSEYRGKITEYVADQRIIIEVAGNSITVDGEDFANIKDIGFDKLGYKNKSRGLWHEMNLGVTVGKSNDFSTAEAHPSILVINGFQFNRFLGVGLGTGYQVHNQLNIIPVYASFRGDVLDSRVTPFYYLDAGYGFGVKKGDNVYFNNEVDVKGGFLVSPGAGVRIKLKKTYLTTSVGYKLQNSQVKRSNNFYDWRFPADFASPMGEGDSSTEKRLYKRVEIRIGIGL
ncbi:MAG: hypothetical protein O2887_05425 [Bacteroidetes bacterium]|nr:hypothetical protein [Bacteroidota bacterium]MDA1119922.1 hypothetical protein [Bacteroidota bacterium]